ncbi:sulfotransferase family protein [Mycobacterium bourgelatii]|uniref:Sulfotransferase n=1 Tax=Mycobacterium bourgelatii TaxID=1273442 RepID=A0A7I9YQ06_MYCBU|nr:sulfotransferase [Mycobacterium bourgelatii]MCV6973831.1 sulfotransferase [Mycobacterium bourgelatii]GFG90553.1 sulfotransferase [Mycobacterium bourgelatii]
MAHWNPVPRTPAAERLYAAAEADRTNNPGRYRLGIEAVDNVVDRATAGRGPGELGASTEWRDALEHYLESAAQDGRLNALGARMVQDTAAAKLRARAAIDRYLSENPAVADRPLGAPIVIVGAWRTGTTFLFRLLAGDPQLRAPLPAELTAPWRIAKLDPDAREKLIDASAAAHDMLHLLNPSMPAVHNSGARLAEECVLAMGTGLRNWAFASTTRLDGYASWLATQDFADEYRRHRRTLQILDESDGRRWLLKAPAHTAELPHLAATYPGACIVHLHRDIVETVASGASLFATYRSTYSDQVDAHDVGRFQTDQTELWLRRALDFRASPAARTVTIVDLRYSDLVADPEAVARRIYAAADLEPPDLPALITQYDTSQPRHAHGAHRYHVGEFGIDADALRERMSFYTAFLASIVED